MISLKTVTLFCCDIGKKLLLLLFMLASCFSQADEKVDFYSGNSTSTAVVEGSGSCFFQIQRTLNEEGLDNLTLGGEKSRHHLERINSIVSDALKDNEQCRLALADFTDVSRVGDVFYDKGGLQAINHLVDELVYDDPDLLQYVFKVLQQGGSVLSSVYSQYSTLWYLYNSLGNFYQVLNDSLAATLKQPPQTIAIRSNQTSLTNCFFSGRKSQCDYPDMAGYAISGTSIAWLLYTGYRLLYVYRDISVPSTPFVASTLTLGTLTSAWWGDNYSVYAIIAVHMLRAYFLATGHHRELISSSKLVKILTASLFASTVLSYIDNLRNTGFWTKFEKYSWLAYYFSTTLAATSIFAYILNIHIPEAAIVMLGSSTSGYIITAFAALHGAQNRNMEHKHLLLVYGGMIINSMIAPSEKYNVIPVLTHYSVVALRYAYSLREHVPDIVEDLDPVYYLLISIILPVLYLLNIPVV